MQWWGEDPSAGSLASAFQNLIFAPVFEETHLKHEILR